MGKKKEKAPEEKPEKKKESKVDALEKEIKEQKEKHLYLLAEFDNYKKRAIQLLKGTLKIF